MTERTHEKHPKTCPNFSAVLVADSDSDPRIPRYEKTLYVARVRCKMWSCAHCAHANRVQWRERMIKHIDQHKDQEWYFVTLTAHGNMRTTDESLANLRFAWDKVRKRIHRRKTQKWHYIRVFEHHKDGALHIHMLTNMHMNIRSWGGMFAKAGGGWNADVRDLHGDTKYKANYMTKYMTKDEGSMPRSLRRVNASHGWAKVEKPYAALDWRVQSFVSDRDVIAYKQVIDVQTDHVVTLDDYIDHPFYPPEDE